MCVKRFLGLRSDLVFAAIKRIKKDETKSLNEDAIVYLYGNGMLNDWEYNFLQNTKAKRNLSLKQLDNRIKINRKVLGAIGKRGFRGQ